MKIYDVIYINRKLFAMTYKYMDQWFHIHILCMFTPSFWKYQDHLSREVLEFQYIPQHYKRISIKLFNQ
jgi:hypothetical protein